LTETEAGR